MSRARWAWWAGCSLVGGVLVALPDADHRLVSFSRDHGPSALDALGVVILIAGWGVLGHALWAHRADLATLGRTSPPTLLAGAFAAGLGAGLVVASVLADFAHWWALGAVILGGAQVGAVLALRTGRGARQPMTAA